MPDLVCVKCQRKLRIEKNGVNAIEFTPVHTKEGKFLQLEPYQVHDTDKWKCPTCGIEVLAGFGQQPWAIEGMTWKVDVKPGVQKDLDFPGMLQILIHDPKKVHVHYTDFGKEEQKAVEEMLTDDRVTVILNVRENKENASGTTTADSGDGSGEEGRNEE
jgi:hypothetical protein